MPIFLQSQFISYEMFSCVHSIRFCAVSSGQYCLHSECCIFKDELRIMYFLPEVVNELLNAFASTSDKEPLICTFFPFNKSKKYKEKQNDNIYQTC